MSSPTSFPGYVNLPTELKLKIVQQAAEHIEWSLKARTLKYANEQFAQYACIDRVWQDVIERANFRHLTILPSDIVEFGNICGKRQGILHKIRFVMCPCESHNVCGRYLWNLTTADARATMNKSLYRPLEALFGVMKDWSTTERRRPNLISLELSVSGFYFPFTRTIHYDFSGLPTVGVIGNVFSCGFPLFHPSSAISIYKKLPNLEVVYLQLEVQPTVPSVSQEARGVLISEDCAPFPKIGNPRVCTNSCLCVCNF